MELMILFIAAATAANIALTSVLLALVASSRESPAFGGGKKEESAQQDRAGIDADMEQRERLERRGSIDEGFENIMRFSVNGKTGFEPEEAGL